MTNLPQPLYNRVLIQPIVQDSIRVLPSGLSVVNGIKEKEHIRKGRVLAIGPGFYSQYTGKFVPLLTQVGQTVYLDGTRSIDEIPWESGNLWLVEENIILAIIPEDKQELKLVPNTPMQELKTNIVQLFPQAEPVVTKEPEK